MHSNKSKLFLLIFCAAAILCFYQSAVAQSGRRLSKPTPTPQPSPPTAAPKTAIKPASSEPADEAEATKPDDVQIKSILISGEIQHTNRFFRSTYLGSTLKETVETLKKMRPAMEATKGEKLTFTEAQAKAKKETDVYILWLGFAVTNDAWGNNFIQFVEYAVLIPETGKRLTYGRVKLGESTFVNKGSVLQLPKQCPYDLSYLKITAREIVYRLQRYGWL